MAKNPAYQLVKQYDPNNPQTPAQMRSAASQWWYFFKEFKDPEGAIQSWLIAGVTNAESASWLSANGVTANDYSRFATICAEHGLLLEDFKPSAVKRALESYDKSEGTDLGEPAIGLLLDGDLWASRRPE